MRTVKPTRRQKEKIAKWKLKADNWLVVKEDGIKLVIKHKVTGNERTLIG